MIKAKVGRLVDVEFAERPDLGVAEVVVVAGRAGRVGVAPEVVEGGDVLGGVAAAEQPLVAPST